MRRLAGVFAGNGLRSFAALEGGGALRAAGVVGIVRRVLEGGLVGEGRRVGVPGGVKD